MTKDIRASVVGALDKCTGALNVPDHARPMLTGQDFDLTRLEMDSLTVMEFILALETDLDLEIDADEIDQQPTLNGLVAHLEARLAARV